MRKLAAGITVLLLITVMVAPSVLANGTYPDPGTSVTNIVTQNKATGVGEDAQVVVNYYDTTGNLDYTNDTITIAPKAVREIKTQDEPLGDGWEGSAVMSSDQPLAAVVSVRNSNVPGAADGFTQGAYNGASEGATTIYFPSVFRFQYIVSRLTVQNTEGTPANVTLYFSKRDGTNAGTLAATIPAYAQRTFYLGNPSDVPATFPADFVDGSVYVTSANMLAGAAVTTWGNRSAAYQALTDNNKGTTLYAPSHYRYMANPASSVWTLSSALNLQNTTGSVANVQAKYYGRANGALYLTKNFTIAPYSAAGLNTKNGGDFPASDFDPLSYAGGGVADWDGSVTITSDQPLVGVGITNWDSASHAGSYALVTPNDGSNVLFVPAQYRLDWGSGWAQWSAINLMNVGGGPILAADLSIQYIDQAGNEVETFTGTELPGSQLDPGAAWGLNTRNGGDLPGSAFNGFPTVGGYPRFIGGIYVTAPAGSKLVGVANIIYDNRASVYNAIP